MTTPADREQAVLNIALNLRLAASELNRSALELDRQAWAFRDTAKKVEDYAASVIAKLERPGQTAVEEDRGR